MVARVCKGMEGELREVVEVVVTRTSTRRGRTVLEVDHGQGSDSELQSVAHLVTIPQRDPARPTPTLSSPI